MTKFIVIATVIICCILSCAETGDEHEYRKSAKQLKNILLKLESIPAEQKIIESTGKGVSFVIDLSKRAEYIKHTKNEWISIANKLMEFSEQYPKSVYADDSLFCLFLLGKAGLSETPNEFDKIELYALRKLVYSYNEIKLEKWTENMFEKIFLKDFYLLAQSALPKELSSQDKFKEMLKYSLATQLLRTGNNNEAVALFNELSLKYKGYEIQKMTENQTGCLH